MTKAWAELRMLASQKALVALSKRLYVELIKEWSNRDVDDTMYQVTIHRTTPAAIDVMRVREVFVFVFVKFGVSPFSNLAASI